ncbi:MAG TPA: DUF2332 family protein [Ferrovibrio sp.]|uniref:DUF2332 domain-containing protein n=1 Tax=Ferrovibrio sp. TaxID=1917215 RepID=UPI002ED20380
MPIEGVIQHFEEQAEACRRLGSPFTAAVLAATAQALAGRPFWAETILAWPSDPRPAALALRLAGALHRLVLDRADHDLFEAYRRQRIDPALIDSVLARHGELLEEYLRIPPQTNDPQRSAVLLGGFLMIASRTRLPLAIAEIGASAGLNQLWDCYGYSFGSWQWSLHEPVPLRLRAEWEGKPPPMAALSVHSRAGCDIAPIDPRDEAQRQRLLSYIWADQPARLRRVQTALACAAERKLQVEKQRARTFVARQLGRRPAKTAFVLYHSIVWQYIPRDEQRHIERSMQQAGAAATPDAPVAWLRFEPGTAKDGADLTLTLWPEGDTQILAAGDYHGRWIRWRGGGDPRRIPRLVGER